MSLICNPAVTLCLCFNSRVIEFSRKIYLNTLFSYSSELTNMAGLVDFRNEEEVKEYLKNIEIEFMFGCHKEHDQDNCYRLGEFLQTMKKNFSEASKIYKNCCEQFENAPCCYKAGQFHLVGRGDLEESSTEAFKSFYVACTHDTYSDMGKNDAIAASCCNMGILLSQDDPNRENYMEILKNGKMASLSVATAVLDSYTRACNLNDKIGCNLLSMLHLAGFENEVKQDYKLAAKYAEKACDLGEAKACHNLGLMFKRGDGVEQSDKRAMEFKTKYRDLIRGELSLQFGNK